MLADVADDVLEEQLSELLCSGGRTEARIVAHLAEVDARRLSLRQGQSLWEYCLQRLGLSESEAYYRIGAARLGQRFPLVFELLERREVHLTALTLLGKYLTDENHAALLSEARGKTKRQILEMLVQYFPKADVASELRRLPAQRETVAAGPSGVLEPLGVDRYRLQLQVTGTVLEKLERARDLMSHANPSGDLAIVVERALDALLAKLLQRRFGDTAKPKRAQALETGTQSSVEVVQSSAEEPRARSADSKRGHVRHAVRRQVLARDGLCCSYVSPDGRR
jgi:hypothetical protein